MNSPVVQPQPTPQVTAATPASRRPDRAVVAWLRLARVFQKVNRATSEALRDAGLSLGQFDVLVQIGSSEGATQQHVADALLVTKSNVCQLLDRLERAGLVERRQHGRSNLLFLTADGRGLYDRVVPAHERQIAGLLSSLGPDEQSQLLGLLRKLDHALV